MIERLRTAFRRITGRKMIKSVAPLEGLDQLIDFRGNVIWQGNDMPAEVRADLELAWRFLLGKLTGTVARHEPACPNSEDGFHCAHWHFGRQACCYCGLQEHEERDPVRWELFDGPYAFEGHRVL